MKCEKCRAEVPGSEGLSSHPAILGGQWCCRSCFRKAGGKPIHVPHTVDLGEIRARRLKEAEENRKRRIAELHERERQQGRRK